jgi:predicted nucleic acid-binding protein
MMLSADTNLFLYAANPACAQHPAARRFFDDLKSGNEGHFVVCGLVLLEVYMQLRNPAVLRRPLSAAAAAAFCVELGVGDALGLPADHRRPPGADLAAPWRDALRDGERGGLPGVRLRTGLEPRRAGVRSRPFSLSQCLRGEPLRKHRDAGGVITTEAQRHGADQPVPLLPPSSVLSV